MHPVPQTVPVRPDGSVILSYDPTPEAVAARLRAVLADAQQFIRDRGESGPNPANIRILERILDDPSLPQSAFEQNKSAEVMIVYREDMSSSQENDIVRMILHRRRLLSSPVYSWTADI